MAADPWADFPAVDPDPDVQYFQPPPPVQTPTPANPTVGDFMQNPAIQGPPAQSLGTLPPDTTSNNLAMIRGRFAQEMQQNPDLRRKFMASINAEVGSQGAPAQQAYAETVLNRAASRGLSLDATISSRKYYPDLTTSQLGATMSQAQQDQFNPIINNALSGSNVTNLATGNESGKLRTLPVTYASGGERFGIESADKRWVQGMGRIAQQTPSPAPTPTLPQIGTGKLSPEQLLAQYNSIAGKVSPTVYQPVFRPYQPTQAQPLL
jgi:hypothetical protein